MRDAVKETKQIGHIGLLAEVPNANIEYCEENVRALVLGPLVRCFYLPYTCIVCGDMLLRICACRLKTYK